MQPTDDAQPTGITVRHPSGLLSPDLPRHWYADQPFASHFLNALSTTFPDGEAFFVRSVLHYRDRVEDPTLREAIKGFAAQEGQHSRIHADHVEILLAQGYTAIAPRNRLLGRFLKWLNRRAPIMSLGSTAALEHLTAILARQILSHPDRWTSQMHPDMARLWRWHALEEAEHKAVAFDVMRVVGIGHGRCVWEMLKMSLILSLEVLDRLAYMLWKDGLLFRLSVWRAGGHFLFGREGLLRGVGSEYRAWYRRDFHPDDIDDKPLIELRGSEIAAELAA